MPHQPVDGGVDEGLLERRARRGRGEGEQGGPLNDLLRAREGLLEEEVAGLLGGGGDRGDCGGKEDGDDDTLERHGLSFRVIQEGGAAAGIAAGSSPVRQSGLPGTRVKDVRERSRNGQSPVDRRA